MIKINLYSITGEKKEAISLPVNEKFLKLNNELISQAVYVEQNNVSRKSGHAKTKGEVSGGGRKPWKQKGTGRARAGSTRSPIFRGGGATFGPRAVGRYLQLPKSMKQLAVGQIVVNKAQRDQIVAIDSLESKEGKTKNTALFAEKVIPGKESIVLFQDKEKGQAIAWRNLAFSTCATLSDLKLRDLLSSKIVVLSQEGVKELFAKLK